MEEGNRGVRSIKSGSISDSDSGSDSDPRVKAARVALEAARATLRMRIDRAFGHMAHARFRALHHTSSHTLLTFARSLIAVAKTTTGNNTIRAGIADGLGREKAAAEERLQMLGTAVHVARRAMHILSSSSQQQQQSTMERARGILAEAQEEHLQEQRNYREM